MDSYFVSVIVPNYNHAPFLKERIDSILNQTYQNFELIILDDKSTDKSYEIIKQYEGNPHVSHVVYNDANSGSTFRQWHKGFSLAKGKLIWIAESDDSCDKCLLEKLVAEFKQNKNLVLAFCSSIIVDENSAKKNVIYDWGKSNFCIDGKSFVKLHLSYDNYIYNASSVVFEKDVAMSIDRMYERFRASGDWLFWIEICEKGNVACVVEPMNFFRKHYMNVTEKYESDGTQQKENRLIFNYLKQTRLINFAKSLKLKFDHIYFYKYDVCFQNDEIKAEVLNVWKSNFLIDFCLFIRRILHKIKEISYGYSFKYR